MAFIDFDDQRLANGDLWMITHQRSKIRNILEVEFPDVPRVQFDISDIIGKPLASNMIVEILVDHLRDYGVSTLEYDIDIDRATGVVDIELRPSSDLTNIGAWE